ncbi:hypothetical protein SD209_32185 [Pseudomonas aeruginosa]|uniref:DUF5983 family protein n=1 Tax=Pseudomonas aeruginosa TaxID=287 RepID=UPI00298FC0E7|nr:hypothetical protein [Pseudomonas aeruginosa]WPD44490.1 hypothetical protein SD209_32185 [Pseudomonas aeruginosa]
MSPNPFLRGYDKLSIQLVVHDLQPCSTVRELSYVVHAKDQEQTLVLGVQPTLELARGIVERLSFETGHFSRCWEISAEHLPEDVVNRMFLLPTELHALQLELFETSAQSVIGCKLRNTPWTDKHLDLLNTSPAELRQRQLEYGLPIELVEILHLAGQADVRFLLFDPDAALLDGLPSFRSVA